MIYYFDTKTTNPFYNLAFEEYFFNKKPLEDIYIILWQNVDTVVVGKYQNIYDEININYVKRNNINVVRRNSGGGSVYHDIGNLNYSFIFNYNSKLNFRDYSKPIIKSLKELGIDVHAQGRNDIYYKMYKISGTAQYIKNNKVLHHGTLLIDSNLWVLKKALNKKLKIVDSTACQSKKSHVCNIKELLGRNVSIEETKKIILSQFNNKSEYYISEKEHSEILSLMKNKYMTKSWNVRYMPECNYINKKNFSYGTVKVSAIIENFCIKYLEFSGDFFVKKDLCELEESFRGIDLHDNFYKKMKDLLIEDYFLGISTEDIYSLFGDLIEDISCWKSDY